MPDHELISVLREAQRVGIIGPTDVTVEVAHALQYVPGIPTDARDVVDLGSGGGLPGLVIARARPDLHIVLVERRAKRADFLRRAVGSLDLGSRVSVDGGDAGRMITSAEHRHAYDVVTARAFAAAPVTVAYSAVLLRPGGVLLVSLPPDGEIGPLVVASAAHGARVERMSGGQVASVTFPTSRSDIVLDL